MVTIRCRQNGNKRVGIEERYLEAPVMMKA